MTRHYSNTMPMRRRMMNDWMLYSLEKFQWYKLLEDRIPARTATMTSNDPKTLAGSVTALMKSARMSVRCPTADQPKEVREAGRAVEQFYHGILQQVEGQQGLMVNTRLRGQLCFWGSLRGFLAGLHVLTKDEQGNTTPHIEVWDPLNVYWGVTPGGRGEGNHPGLAWACHFSDLNSWRMDDRFGGMAGDITGGLTPTYVAGGDPIYRVYDYYDREYNVVVVDGKVISKQPHFGQGYVPVTIIPIGNPLVIDSQSNAAYTEEFGESVYTYNRDLYPKENAILSAKFEQVLRFINPAVKLPSVTGRFTLPGWLANPYDRGQRFRLNARNEEDIVPMEQPPMKREVAELEAAMSVMNQKGGLPSVVHGQSDAPSSGYNTNLLQQQGYKHIIEPRLEALDQFYEGMERFFRRQFSSGYFEAMHLQGEIDRKTPFNTLIEPSVIKRAPEPMVKHRLRDPGETAQKMGMAQMVKTMGLFDDLYILDELLDVDDPEAMMKRLALQRVKDILPTTQLYAAYQAAQEDGNEIMMALIEVEIMKLTGGPGLLPNQPGMMRGRQGPPTIGGGAGGGGGQSSGASSFVPTEAGGSPRGGVPNPSDESQLQGRPRPPGAP